MTSSKKPDSKKTGSKKRPEPASSSDAQTPANKKRALKRERQGHRKHFDEVLRGKFIWNKLRTLTRKNDPEEIKTLMEELMELFTGKLGAVALQHDASRIVQAMIKYGSEDQDAIMLDELLGSFIAMSKSTYAHFVCLKLLAKRENDLAAQEKIYKTLKGSVVRLATHAVASRVLEYAMSNLDKKYVKLLQREFYGNEFSIFDDDIKMASLENILAKKPEKNDNIKHHLEKVLLKAVGKEGVHYAFFQSLLWDYTRLFEEISKDIISGVADHAIHLLSTRNGALALCKLIGHGSAKDRKRIVKSLKGYTVSTLTHSHGYLALLKLLQVTDDTVLLQKNLLAEITNADTDEDLMSLVLDNNGSKLFFLLLCPDGHSHFYEDEINVILNHESPDTSKKSDEIRRAELLQFIQPTLVEFCQKDENLVKLLTSHFGSKVLLEIYSKFGNDSMSTQLVNAISSSSDLFEDSNACRAIQKLLQMKQESNDNSSTSFAVKLAEKFTDTLASHIGTSSRGAFVLTALIKCNACNGVKAELMRDKELLMKKSKEAKHAKGYEVLLELLSEDDEAKDIVAPLKEKAAVVATPKRKTQSKYVEASADDGSVGSLHSAGGTPLRRSARKASKKTYKY